MKKAFTMIEIIFVIIVIGILSSIAMPKFISGRNDAEKAKFASEISTILADAQNYVLNYNSLPEDPRAYSNAHVEKRGTAYYLTYKQTDCIQLTRVETNDGAILNFYPKTTPQCKKILEKEEIKKILISKFQCSTSTPDSNTRMGCTATDIQNSVLKTFKLGLNNPIKFFFKAKDTEENMYF